VRAFVARTNAFVFIVAIALLSITFVSLHAYPSVLFAQSGNPPPQDMPFTLAGKIIGHSPGKITVSGGQNMEFDVRYDSKTEIQYQDGSPAKANELKVGFEIQVKGLLTEAGDIIAKKIVIQAKAGGAEK